MRGPSPYGGTATKPSPSTTKQPTLKHKKADTSSVPAFFSFSSRRPYVDEMTSKRSNIGNPTSSERQRGCRGVQPAPLPRRRRRRTKMMQSVCDLSEVGFRVQSLTPRHLASSVTWGFLCWTSPTSSPIPSSSRVFPSRGTRRIFSLALLSSPIFFSLALLGYSHVIHRHPFKLRPIRLQRVIDRQKTLGLSTQIAQVDL